MSTRVSIVKKRKSSNSQGLFHPLLLELKQPDFERNMRVVPSIKAYLIKQIYLALPSTSFYLSLKSCHSTKVGFSYCISYQLHTA